MSLDLNNLKSNRDEILKAEIGSLLFNLGKTHIGFWKEKQGQIYFNVDNDAFESQYGFEPFSNYKSYYENGNFENELNNINPQLKDFIFNTHISINSENQNWVEYFKGNVSNSDVVKKVFFRGSENINSGIDKGSPKEQLRGKLWISNAFGSFIKEVDKKDFDEARICFFEKLDNECKKNNWYSNPNWEDIREFVFKEIKNWYQNLLSDSRMPVNDVTLYDQAYMSATMFKAALAGIFLTTPQSQNYINNPQLIKWQILGVQYDKFSLSEKALKVPHIFWYREAIKKVDDKVKKLIELDYALGNEIYKDESGIYFLVPEGTGDNVLDNSLDEINEKVLVIFKEIFNDEIYPYIGLTKSSRGTMNLTNLLENAKSNFLKADYRLKSSLSAPQNAVGICQVCKNRFVENFERDKDDVPMCEICKGRKQGRIEKWLKNQNGETIWIDEIADKNNRVALIGLKFELLEWLNGDLLSSLLVRDEDYFYWLKQIEIFIKLFYSNVDILQMNIGNLGNSLSNEDRKTLGKKNGLINGVKRDLNNIINFRRNIINNNQKKFNEQINISGFNNILIDLIFIFIEQIDSLIKKVEELLKDNDIVSKITNSDIENLNNLKAELNEYKIRIFLTELTEDAYISCKKWEENFNDYIKQLFFGSITGNIFENQIIRSRLNQKIDWEREIIKWDELEEEDIELLSTLILQFILRKNPSPARLRRVWESTEEFFNDVKREILDTYTQQRTQESFSSKVTDFASLQVQDTIYKQYFSITDISPISWQFVIPTSKIEDFIEKVKKLYYKHFKYVNGKLPLHIGIVVQNSKFPLYIGVKALRNIRRDIKEWSEIKKEGKKLLEDLSCYEEVIEENNNTKNYYSLYETTNNPTYPFKRLPSNNGIKLYNENDEFIIYPNTIDFEYLDTNTRRNDIYYENGKRVAKLKENRPIEWSEWENYKNFKEMFKDKSNQLQTLVSLIYSKMEDWKYDEESFKIFMETTFKRYEIDIRKFGIRDFCFNELKKFIDMFEFWHTVVKEI